ncbi:MAG: four helix bundle protein [Candidatus Taylorbacteria bacterium]|nr:four helix bundle protein [Candidatus Taylorbacteria bacterium]
MEIVSSILYLVSCMENQNNKIKSFTDLNAWKEAHKLAIMIYKATDNFPSKENFGLTSQMRRSAVSVSSNIAEGFSRATNKDKYQFYSIAQGSLTELQNQLLISKDVGYLEEQNFMNIANQTVTVNKLINGLKRIRNQ